MKNRKIKAAAAANEIVLIMGSRNFILDVLIITDMIILFSEDQDLDDIIELFFEVAFEAFY